MSEQMTFSTDVNALSQSKVTARAHDVRTRHMSVAHTVGASFVTSACAIVLWITELDYVPLLAAPTADHRCLLWVKSESLRRLE